MDLKDIERAARKQGREVKQTQKGETVKGWSLRLEAEPASPVTEQQIETLLEELADHAASVSYAPRAIAVRMFVEGTAPEEAIRVGLRVFSRSLKRAGIDASSIVDVEAQAWHDLARAIDEPNIPELVSVSEVARILEVSRQRVSELARSPEFPAPVARLAVGPIWKKSAILRFLKRWPRKPGRPRGTARLNHADGMGSPPGRRGRRPTRVRTPACRAARW